MYVLESSFQRVKFFGFKLISVIKKPELDFLARFPFCRIPKFWSLRWLNNILNWGLLFSIFVGHETLLIFREWFFKFFYSSHAFECTEKRSLDWVLWNVTSKCFFLGVLMKSCWIKKMEYNAIMNKMWNILTETLDSSHISFFKGKKIFISKTTKRQTTRNA